MRVLVASVLAAAVLVLFLPVLCVDSEDEAGSCQSLTAIRVPGSAENGDVWQGVVLAGAVLLFVLVMRVGRGSRPDRD
jgi:hypothetical protein